MKSKRPSSRQPKRERAGKEGGRPQATRLEKKQDSYRARSKRVEKKLAEPKVCTGCKATYHEGRWVWSRVSRPMGEPTLCPACERIRDRRPAGEVHIAGEFAEAHHDEILARIRHVEEREKSEHPLQRVMEVTRGAGETVVTTTDFHLAHAIGIALHDAFKGELAAPWAEKGELMRVHWNR
jgi:hypothetical protein